MESLQVMFGRRIRMLREQKGWTQEELAKAVNLATKHIGVIERGEKTSSFETVEKMARAFEVEYQELFVPTHRRTRKIDEEITSLLDNPARIKVSNVEEFLRGMRALLRKLDRTSS